jgi:hypothetical protein
MITAFPPKNGFIFFFCFFIYSSLLAQIKLDDIKNKITSKAEKEILTLENKNPLQKKVFLDSLQERLKAGDTLIMHYKLNDIKSLINKTKKDSVIYPAIRISIPKKDKNCKVCKNIINRELF